ncbi:sigma-70 family RNA polymerase sigma factor [Hyphococcus sp.]|uniref:sigma-70 family RNA polymerase sigma factor n=1 Tax=Hyphococcus sp. TaxID=2038636 RepID=UPI00208BF73C|nr:MAG: RNA polymerase sigma factor SigJ [Marinicaulis sp.]
MNQSEPDIFEAHRPRLFGLAYRMLGSVADAEDLLQDAYLRWRSVAKDSVENPRAYLSKIVSRLCLDRLKEARRHREVYVGPWLPEPLANDLTHAVSPADDLAENISFALMLTLERLSPLERAAFLLHDVFDMEFSEVADTLGRSEATCRQLASRARTHVRKDRPRYAVEPEQTEKISTAFFAAMHSGDTNALRSLLADDAVFHADGGGKARSARNILHGADRISQFLAGYARKALPKRIEWSRRMTINNLPGELAFAVDGILQTTAIEIAHGRITAIYVTRNPDKLRHLASFAPQASSRLD